MQPFADIRYKVIPNLTPILANEKDCQFHIRCRICRHTRNICPYTITILVILLVGILNISNAICNMLNVVFVALGNAVGILIGQTLGAGKYEKAKKDSFSLMWFTGAVCLILTVILVAVSGVFPQFYDTTEAVRRAGQLLIIITALFFPVQGFLNALYFTLRSGGKTLVTFLFDSVYSWAVTIPVAYFLCEFTSLDIFLIYAIVQSLDFIKILIGFILVKKGVWISNLVENKD